LHVILTLIWNKIIRILIGMMFFVKFQLFRRQREPLCHLITNHVYIRKQYVDMEGGAHICMIQFIRKDLHTLLSQVSIVSFPDDGCTR
jgi:hypothetical protein